MQTELQPKMQKSVSEVGTREQRVLVSLCALDTDEDIARCTDLLSERLNWPWLFMQAMHHRTVCLIWDNLKKCNLVDRAVRTGLTKNWITYAEWLFRENKFRNELWLSHLERIFLALNEAGIPAVCLKGAAFIGDIYHLGNRMLGDIDTLMPRSAIPQIKSVLQHYGFVQGTPDPVTSLIRAMPAERQRLWTFQTHLLPKFTLATGEERCPFLRFAVGFDFFEPGDRFAVPSEVILARAVRKSADSQVYVLEDVDAIINLVVHIYREAVSATFASLGDNWQIYKFCDLLRILRKASSKTSLELLYRRIDELDLRQPAYFSFYYASLVFDDDGLKAIVADLEGEEDKGFLFELVDGRRRIPYLRPFADRLFETGHISIPGMRLTWYKGMNDDEW